MATYEKQGVEEQAGALRERVTARALVIGVLTIVGIYSGLGLQSGGYNLVPRCEAWGARMVRVLKA